LIHWNLSASPRKYGSNTKEIEGDRPRQVRVPIRTLYWSDYTPKDRIPRVWDREPSGGARRPGYSPSRPGAAQNALCALSCQRNSKQRARRLEKHSYFAGILIYRTPIAVHCASIAAIVRVLRPLHEYCSHRALQPLCEYCGHCTSIAAIAHCSHCASIAAIARVWQPSRIAAIAQ